MSYFSIVSIDSIWDISTLILGKVLRERHSKIICGVVPWWLTSLHLREQWISLMQCLQGHMGICTHLWNMYIGEYIFRNLRRRELGEEVSGFTNGKVSKKVFRMTYGICGAVGHNRRFQWNQVSMANSVFYSSLNWINFHVHCMFFIFMCISILW